MMYQHGLQALAFTAILVGSASAQFTNSTGNSSTPAGSAILDPANIQNASAVDGQAAAGAAAGQAASLTDKTNFINFCTGKTLTNGAQVKTGSCNGIVMGDIPAKTNMVSTIITSPGPGQDITEKQTFDVTIQVSNLAAGSFTNPEVTYYAAPQTLKGGNIVGHTHVTIQSLGGSLTPNVAPDPTIFAFFKGINDAGDGKGGLKATVAGGLPAGNYRVCTMSSASNHQPVLMPVAQRGAQDDCNKFTVGGSTGANSTNPAAPPPVAGGSNNGKGGGRGGRRPRKGRKGPREISQ